MSKHILFIQGAGKGAYKEDQKLVERLEHELGAEYKINYPAMPDEENAPYAEWKQTIDKELAKQKGPVILIGHSVGASVLLKYLGETKSERQIDGVFLLATPFWGGDGWHYEGYKTLELPNDLAEKLLQDTGIYLYHCRDDEVVPFDHLALYEKLLPQATSQKLKHGGHQFDEGLAVLVGDMKSTLHESLQYLAED